MISLDLDFMEDMGNLYQKMQTHVPVTLKCNAGILQTCRAPSCVKIPVSLWSSRLLSLFFKLQEYCFLI